MSEELSNELLHTNETFISTLNPECPPFQPLSSSSFQSIQELSSNITDNLNDNKNEFHIEPTVIDHSSINCLHSNGIYSDQSNGNILSNTHHIKEIDQDEFQRISSTAIENLDNENEQSASPIISLKSNESFSTEDDSNSSNNIVDDHHQENEIFEQTSSPLNNDSDQRESTTNNEVEVEDEDENENEDEDEGESESEGDGDGDGSDGSDDDEKEKKDSLETSTNEKISNEFSLENELTLKNEKPIEIENDVNENLNDQNDHLMSEESIEENLSKEIEETEIVIDKDLSSEKKENEFDDVLGNKSLLKKTIRSGENETRPPRNSLATISYELYLLDPITNETKLIENVLNERFFISEYDILPAIDICIQLMDRGELASIDSDIRHCYGNAGCPEKKIPQVKDNDHSYRMRIILELHDWKQIDDIQSLSVEERIFWGEQKRKSGNNFYRRKEYSIALQCYRNALRFLDIDENPLITDENDSITLINNCYIQVENNRAQTFLLNEQYDQCLTSVENVLKHQPNNVKALFRKGKAFFQLGNYDQALESLTILLKIESDDVEKDKVNEMVKICQTKLAKYHRNQKEICQRMFQSKTSPNSSTISRIQHEKQREAKSNPWWGFAAIGGVALVALGLAVFVKYR